MVVGMVDPHSPTATEILASTRQQSAFAAAFAFFSTLVCKTSERSSMFQDSRIRVNLNKDVQTIWRVSGISNSSKPKHCSYYLCILCRFEIQNKEFSLVKLHGNGENSFSNI